MRELTLVADDSDAHSLVFRATEDEDAAYFLQVTGEVAEALRTLLQSTDAQATVTTLGVVDGDADTPTDLTAQAESEADDSTDAATAAAGDAGADTADTAGDADAGDAAEGESDHSDPHSPAEQAAAASEAAGAGEEGADSADAAEDSSANSAAAPAPAAAEPAPAPASVTAQLTLRPREIQARIRGGQTVAEVAQEAGVAESRIEPFAHPVLLERARIADMAKMAHPVRDDGPTALTLFEVVATAFTARDLDLATARWDAYRDHANQWVVTLTWTAGLNEHTAEWSYHGRGQSPETAVARNSLAADLIDPDFARPVRTISPAGHGGGRVTALRPEEEPGDDLDRTRDDLPVVEDDTLLEGESLLQHPQAPKKPAKRKSVSAPAWEDVLLGVRGSTKRPRK
ncbi:DUF3071 domain-containing protein [Corynebacterium sp. 13CS0277]|uniref:septation protein SepH n=1 Tax=Corynebacterium sp. 13CS0277 TaxID=2071994 RepID=UPI000D03BE76|nr:septation protein SepH [Corynebacterium sp. 13CS0277]PRQ11000.1 DUF3071 domain-containing protein [Corynebacterium sp. 13CS0277]